MAKRFLSIVLVLALSMTMFVFEASAADETFTIALADDPENHAYSSTYSPYTLAGTEVTVSPDVDLEEGQEIHWFLNGNEVGTSGLTGEEEKYAENFTFNSVDGENVIQAKVMSGDTVVATSNEITMDFTPLVKNGSDIFSMKLDAFESKWLYGKVDALNGTYVSDPAGSSRNVMKIERTAASAVPNDEFLRIDQGSPDEFTAAQTGSGIVRVDYSIYVNSSAAKLSLMNMWFSCGTKDDYTYSLVADNYSYANGDTVIAGPVKSRNASLPHNEWVDVSIIIDNTAKTYDVTIGDDQVVTGRSYCTHSNDGSYFKSFVLPTTLSTGVITYYLKDFSVYKCIPAGISISSTSLGNAKAVAGSKVVINTESTFADADVVYYCNGVKYTDNKVVASAGTNTVYAQAIGASGNVLGTSDPIEFEAYADTFKTSYTNAAATNLQAPGGTDKAVPGRYNANITATRLYYNSMDVKPEIVSNMAYIAPTFDAKKGNIFPVFFRFYSDRMNLTTEIGSNGAAVTGKNIDVPYVAGQDTYNIKVIYDPFYGSYILLIDDVVYSVIDVSATKGTTNDLTPNKGDLYFDTTVNKSDDEANPNKATFSNYKEGYSEIPANHSAIEYINNAQLVTNRGEIDSADDLTVKFTAIKGGFDKVLCIATVLEDGGALVSLATQDVTFGEDDSKPVSLKLENLPAGIADGEYTVNVMLWDAENYTPIVSKIVLPN